MRRYLNMYHIIPKKGFRALRQVPIIIGKAARDIIFKCEGLTLSHKSGELRIYTKKTTTDRKLRRFCRNYAKLQGGEPGGVKWWTSKI